MMSERQRKRKQREQMMMFGAIAMIALALLLLIFALWLLLGGREEPAETPRVQQAEEPLESEEEPDDEPEPEPERVSTVKTVEGETDETTYGIDVSEFQGNIDWTQAAQGDIDFVMVRVGCRSSETGKIEEDRCARYNLQEAAARGLYLGAYFFSTATTEEEAREEAEWTCELLAGYPITYPVAYNCEGFQNESSRQYGMSAEERSHLAEVFLDEVEEEGYTGMFYAAKSELENNLLWNTEELELQYRMWVARYSLPGAERPDYSGECAMWQYTNQGEIPGVDSLVDRNAAYFGFGSPAPAKQEGAAMHVEANPEVGVKFEEVNEQVTSKDVTNLRSSMDQGGDNNIVTQLKNGDTATRTGRGNNGWSRLTYNGQTLYAVSSYLTTDLSYTPPAPEPGSEFKTKFTAVTENVTAKDVTNLRNRPSVEEPSEVIVQLHNGEVVARTGVSELGWSRVEYNGQTLYCISSYLQVVE